MQPTLKDWLARKPKGKAKRKRIPAMSAKRKGEAREYSRKRKAFLEEHPDCNVWFPAWVQGMGYWAMPVCERKSTDVHHKAGRLGGNYLDETTWLPVCRACHNWIHTNPNAARALGLLA